MFKGLNVLCKCRTQLKIYVLDQGKCTVLMCGINALDSNELDRKFCATDN